ncbi:MAG TPA: ClcB-like voltage-gated chloride channel protein, partial [Chthoniobacterales bacterium]
MSEAPPAPSRSTLPPVLHGLLVLKVWVVERFRLGERQVTLIWALIIGVAGALVSELFRKASDGLTQLLTGSTGTTLMTFGNLPGWERFAVPTAGGLLAGTVLWTGHRLIASVRQKSTTDYMEAIVVGNGFISGRASFVKALSALFSISSGASIGREGPLVQLSTLVASLIGRLRRLPTPQRRHLVACGAAAGIASAYHAPIAGAFFVAEIVLGTVVVESLGPLILASVAATFTNEAMHTAAALYKSPELDLHSRWEAVPLALMGLLMGLLAPLYLRLLKGTERLFGRLQWTPPFKLALGGALVGTIAVFYPEVCGNGQNLIRSIFHQNWAWDTVLLVIAVKLVATLVTFGSGAVGGVFTPTLFIGAATGVLYGQTVLYLMPELQPDPTIYGLVGMGTFIAAATGAPLMAILIVFELTLSYGIVPYLMMDCVIAYYCCSIFDKRFLYGESLERKGAAFFSRQLAQVNLIDLIRRNPVTLRQNASFAQIAETFVQNRFQHIYIVDGDGRLLGAVSLHDVKTFLDRPELESVVIAADIMDENFPRIAP